MEASVFRRPQDLGDEANSYGYSEFEPFNEPSRASAAPLSTRSTTASAVVDTGVSRGQRPPAARAGPPKRDLMAMKRVMDMTTSLQGEQDAKEAQAKIAADEEAERLRRERNAKWEAVKASMSARPTPLHTVRAYDSDMSDSEDEGEGGGGVGGTDVQSIRSLRSVRSTTSTHRATALDTLVPTLTEERAVRRGALYAVESVPQRVCHFIYNWWMYFVYALSSGMLPGMNSRKGNDPEEYYNRKKYA